jgi:hypothetical protein
MASGTGSRHLNSRRSSGIGASVTLPPPRARAAPNDLRHQGAQHPFWQAGGRPDHRTANQWEPLKQVPTLYLQFARLDGSAEACRDFATSYGLLTTPAKTGAAERVADWQREIKWMQRLTAIGNSDVAADCPTQLLQRPQKCRIARLRLLIVRR